MPVIDTMGKMLTRKRKAPTPATEPRDGDFFGTPREIGKSCDVYVGLGADSFTQRRDAIKKSRPAMEGLGSFKVSITCDLFRW